MIDFSPVSVIVLPVSVNKTVQETARVSRLFLSKMLATLDQQIRDDVLTIEIRGLPHNITEKPEYPRDFLPYWPFEKAVELNYSRQEIWPEKTTYPRLLIFLRPYVFSI